MNAGKTGYLSIVTDTSRAALLRFQQGKLVQSNVRSKNVSDAIQVINQCRQVKFTYADAPVDGHSDIMPMDTFLQLILLEDDSQVPSSKEETAETEIAYSEARVLKDMAANYLGPIADFIVEEALANNENMLQAVQSITKSIPDPNQAGQFKSEVLAILRDI